MKQRMSPSPGQENTPSLADTLNAGAGVFLRRWWVLIIPVAIDAWLYLSQPINARGLMRGLGAALDRLAQFMGTPAAQRADIAAAAQGLQNLDVRTAGVAAQLLPTLLNGRLAAEGAGSLDSVWLLTPLLLALNAAALLASSLALLPLADAITNPGGGLGRVPAGWRRVGRTSWRLGLYLALVLGVQALLGGPTLVCSLWLLAISPLAAQLVGTGWLAAMLALWVYASFGVEAIVIHDTPVRVAAYRSYNIVHDNLWPAMALVGAAFVLGYGFRFALSGMLTTTWGALLASAGYGALMATLSAARMLFYRDRLARLVRTRPVFMAPGSEV